MTSPSSIAQAAKEKGNAAFKAGNYPDAIGHYTRALLADKDDVTYPLNRAAAYLKLGKNEDAERDCSSVLATKPTNAKALFRRAQARTGMGRFSDALKDLNVAYKIEPANDAVKIELKKVGDMMIEAKKKATTGRAKSLDEVATKTFNKPVIPSQTAAPHPKRRRVPITIVDPTGKSSRAVAAASTSSKSKSVDFAPPASAKSASTKTETNKPSTKIHSSSSTQPDDIMMSPVSSRSLRTSSTHDVSSNPQSIPLNTAPVTPKTTFKDAKQARESAKPSRVGGGIFRATGSSNVVGEQNLPRAGAVVSPTPTLASNNASPAVDSDIPKPSRAAIPVADAGKRPLTLFDFKRAWDSTAMGERWDLLCTIPFSTLPALFKTSLEPSHLSSLLECFVHVLRHYPDDSELRSKHVRAYLDALARVPRFGTVLLFMSPTEKAAALDVWKEIGDEPKGAWAAVLS